MVADSVAVTSPCAEPEQINARQGMRSNACNSVSKSSFDFSSSVDNRCIVLAYKIYRGLEIISAERTSRGRKHFSTDGVESYRREVVTQ